LLVGPGTSRARARARSLALSLSLSQYVCSPGTSATSGTKGKKKREKTCHQWHEVAASVKTTPQSGSSCRRYSCHREGNCSWNTASSSSTSKKKISQKATSSSTSKDKISQKAMSWYICAVKSLPFQDFFFYRVLFRSHSKPYQRGSHSD